MADKEIAGGASLSRMRWTEEELDILRRNCADHSVTGLMVILPGRTDSAIEIMIRKLGLPRFRPAAPPSADWREWAEAERDIVRQHYAGSSMKDLLAMLPGRTSGAIVAMAAKLGVRKSWDVKTRNRREAKEGKTRSRAEARELRRDRDANGAGQEDPRNRL